MAASYADGFVRVYEFAAGTLQRRLEFKASDPAVPISNWPMENTPEIGFADPDGQLLATRHGQKFKIWDLRVNPPKELSGGAASRMAVSPNGKTLAAAHQGEIRLWDLGETPPRPVPNWTVKAGIGFGDGMAFTPDGKQLMIASEGKVALWSVTPGQTGPLSTAVGAAGIPALSMDGKVLFVLTEHGELRAFDAPGIDWKERSRGHVRMGRPVFSHDGGLLLTQQPPTLWDLSGPAPVEKALPESVKAGVLLGWRAQALVLVRDNRLWEWPGEGEPSQLCDLGPGQVDGFHLTQDGKGLALTRETRPGQAAVEVWDLQELPPRKTASLETLGNVSHLQFSADAKKLAVGGHTVPSRLFVLDGAAWKEAWVSHSTERDGMALTAAGDRVATLCFVEGSGIWDTSALPPRLLHKIPAIRPYSADFSPDGRFLVTAGEPPIPLALFNTRTGALQQSWSFPLAAAFAAFAPDGRHFAVQYSHGCIWILRLELPPAEPVGDGKKS